MIGFAIGTASDIEILWISVALVGFVWSLWNAREAWLDLKEVSRRGITNGRRALARANIFTECGRAAIQAIFVMIGVFAMLFPEPLVMHEPQRLTIYRFFFRWGLIVASLILTAKSYALRRVRQSFNHH